MEQEQIEEEYPQRNRGVMLNDKAVELQLITSDIVDNILLPFLGFTRIGDSIVEIEGKQSLINKIGVNGIQPFFAEFNRITFLGKLREDEIRHNNAKFKSELATVLAKNYRTWELADKSYLDAIVGIFGRLHFLCQTRAIGGFTMESLNKQIQIVQTTSLQERKEGKLKKSFDPFKNLMNRR